MIKIKDESELATDISEIKIDPKLISDADFKIGCRILANASGGFLNSLTCERTMKNGKRKYMKLKNKSGLKEKINNLRLRLKLTLKRKNDCCYCCLFCKYFNSCRPEAERIAKQRRAKR